MRTKKIFVILIAVFFVFALVFCGIFIFSINKVEVTYAVSDETDITEIQNLFDEFEDDNLLFLDTDKVKTCLNGYPYFEVTSVEKSFPNVLNVKVTERREAYHMEYDENIYVTTKEGILLNIIEKAEYQNVDSREIIYVTFDGVEVTQAVLGKNIQTTSEYLILSMYEMAKAVNLTDCIRSIEVNKLDIETNDIIMHTYTGVIINVYKANERGTDKVKEAFTVYENSTTDFQKLNSIISVTLLDSGEIRVTWEEGKRYYE